MTPPSSADLLKAAAGRHAADLVKDGMVVGLGTGSTAAHALRRLGERVRDEGLRISGIPTSSAAESLAREVGIPLTSFEQTTRLDLTIDGADEVDSALNLIKGGGGALLREKVVARRSREVVIVVDPAKLVARLGAAFPLPVEIVPFAHRPAAEELAALGAAATLRRRGEAPYVTDNGNFIVDLRFPAGIADPVAIERSIREVAGVVESGLFIAIADRLVVGRENGPEVTEAHRRHPGRA